MVGGPVLKSYLLLSMHVAPPLGAQLDCLKLYILSVLKGGSFAPFCTTRHYQGWLRWDFLKKRRTKMNGADGRRRWKNIKHRLGLGGFCWGVETFQKDHRTEPLLSNLGHVPSDPPGMNLATALAAERNSRAGNEGPIAKVHVKFLIRLTEETESVDHSNKKRKRSSDGQKGGDKDWVCCVCMERNKGAAFIPCGHAFCRVCSRELWVKCGSCPMCNGSIVQILDIY